MRIYFSGLGGVGIGPLAQIASCAGYDIVGSDRQSSLMTDELKKSNMNFEIGDQDGTFLEESHAQKPIDWFVYTSSLSNDHPELVAARRLNIKIAKRDELLNRVIEEKKQKLIALAGTHGKTGSTAMAVWIFNQLKIPVSYSIGSTISFGPSGFYTPKSQYFVYECDEFDRNFLHFSPYLSIITSLDYDHSDTYPTVKSYREAFRQFVERSNHVVAWNSQPEEVFRRHNSILLNDNEINKDITLSGEYNRKNATLLLKGLQDIGIITKDNYLDAITAINSFPGAKRRFEKLATNLYTDYGHHPIEIEATLKRAREITDKKIVLVYQPHQNVRQYAIKDDYKFRFKNADKIFWLPTYLTREDPSLKILSSQELTEDIVNKDRIVYAKLDDLLWQKIEESLSKGDFVLGMGAGTVDDWLRDKISTKK